MFFKAKKTRGKWPFSNTPMHNPVRPPAGPLACLLACLLARSLACLLACLLACCSHARSLARSLACLLTCLLACRQTGSHCVQYVQVQDRVSLRSVLLCMFKFIIFPRTHVLIVLIKAATTN